MELLSLQKQQEQEQNNKGGETKQLDMYQEIVASLSEDSIKELWLDENGKPREFTDVYVLFCKGNTSSSTIPGMLINGFVAFTGEFTHCELVFASKPRKEEAKPPERNVQGLSNTTQLISSGNSQITKTDTKKSRATRGRDIKINMSNLRQQQQKEENSEKLIPKLADQNDVEPKILKSRTETRKVDSKPFYVAFRINSTIGKVTFQKLKQMGREWTYAALNFNPEAINLLWLWALSQKDKPFDNWYVPQLSFAWLARLNFYKRVTSLNPSIDLNTYTCVSLVAACISLVFPELANLFDYNKKGCGPSQDIKIWHLSPTSLYKLLESYELYDHSKKILLKKIKVEAPSS